MDPEKIAVIVNFTQTKMLKGKRIYCLFGASLNIGFFGELKYSISHPPCPRPLLTSRHCHIFQKNCVTGRFVICCFRGSLVAGHMTLFTTHWIC
ncbi:hypothetical protein PR048_014018 [Dryococelus australis]|uniref:Uncharacterized protein n=1 Tax=Dryococelus australis TaxID=614101 RepID=A0ABQ9HUR1_9NEOP|nr:hypothetical protein PR048_014018 [Dryococelus australis]